MASLDDLEGGAVELASVGVLAAILIIAYMLWKSFHGFDPLKALADLLRKLWNAIDTGFAGAIGHLSPLPLGTDTSGNLPGVGSQVDLATGITADYPGAGQ